MVDPPHDLVTIDVTTGMVTLVGSTGQPGVQALAFSPDGTLFGWDIRRGLATINTSTGLATLVNPGFKPDVVDHNIQGMAFAPDGTLLGARESLFTINVKTGIPTLIGSGGYSDIRGLAFIKGSQPAPSKKKPVKKRGPK